MDELKKILDSITLSETTEQLPYSILPMMYDRISTKELLHSQIIASLLDPNEKHNLGDHPLSLFLNRIGFSDFGSDLYKTKVKTEKGVEDMRRIDILLTNGENAIIIENKLNNAIDQPNQLKDYLKSISNEKYTKIIIVYLPLYAYKSANEKVEANVVNLYPQDLIEWLTECKTPVCDNYINLLKYMNQTNRNFMEAKKILSELSAQQIEKLTAVAAIVNSPDWYTARFEPITTAVKAKVTGVQISTGYILSLWLGDCDYDFWVAVYARDTTYDLYVVDYNVDNAENLPDKLTNTGYAYDSVECSKRYFRQAKSYPLVPLDNPELVNDIVELLKLSKK